MLAQLWVRWLTCLLALFLEHLVAPFLCFSALNSGIKVFFFFFSLHSTVILLYLRFLPPALRVLFPAMYIILHWGAGFVDVVYPSPQCPRIKSVFAVLTATRQKRKRQRNAILSRLSNNSNLLVWCFYFPLRLIWFRTGSETCVIVSRGRQQDWPHSLPLWMMSSIPNAGSVKFLLWLWILALPTASGDFCPSRQTGKLSIFPSVKLQTSWQSRVWK